MTFEGLLAALPKLTPEERQLLMRRILELEDEAPPAAPGGQSVEERRAEYLKNPSSALSVEQIVHEVRRLPRRRAVELFDHLLIGTFASPDSGIEAVWRNEVRRRIADIESGKERGVDGDEVLADLRRIVGR